MVEAGWKRLEGESAGGYSPRNLIFRAIKKLLNREAVMACNRDVVNDCPVSLLEGAHSVLEEAGTQCCIRSCGSLSKDQQILPESHSSRQTVPQLC